MIDWNDRTIKWYSRAAEESGFFKELANEVLPYIDERSTVIDIGCGLGFLSTELAGKVGKVTAIDKSENAINALTKRCEQYGITNLEPICASVDSWRPEQKCDTLVMSFFGDIGKSFELYSSFARKYIVAILHWEQKSHNFKIKDYLGETSVSINRTCIEEVAPQLTAKEIPFKLKEIINDFGQPLESIQDATDFITNYYKFEDNGMIKKYLSENLCKRGSGYYLPNSKKSGVLVIDLQSLANI